MGFGTDLGFGSGLSLVAGADLGFETDLGFGSGLGLVAGADLGFGSDLGFVSGADLDFGSGLGFVAGADLSLVVIVASFFSGLPVFFLHFFKNFKEFPQST